MNDTKSSLCCKIACEIKCEAENFSVKGIEFGPSAIFFRCCVE